MQWQGLKASELGSDTYERILVELDLRWFKLYCLILFPGRAWREKLEKAEIRKREETKELQVICSEQDIYFYCIF